jgi:hypothetical protein
LPAPAPIKPGRARRRWASLALIATLLVVLSGCWPKTRVFGPAIEPTVPYQPAGACNPALDQDKPGPIALRDLLMQTYGSTVGGQPVLNDISRPCDGSVSEHFEGRALDWGMDYRNPAMQIDGNDVLNWLFATDEYGNRDAIARRLGIMYVIWNYQIYGSWNDYQPSPYACGSDPVSCHVTHMHFSFDWPGALAQTSFFTGRVAVG